MLLSKSLLWAWVTVISEHGHCNGLIFCFLGVSRYNIQDKDTFFDNATRSRIVSKQVNQMRNLMWWAQEGVGKDQVPSLAGHPLVCPATSHPHFFGVA